MYEWNTMWDSLQTSLGLHIPQLLGALAILVIGWFVAALVKAGRCGQGAVALSPEEKVRELVMLSLRTTKGLRLAAYRQATGLDFIKDNEALVTALRQNELIRLSGGHLRLTKNGFLVSNVILERLSF